MQVLELCVSVYYHSDPDPEHNYYLFAASRPNTCEMLVPQLDELFNEHFEDEVRLRAQAAAAALVALLPTDPLEDSVTINFQLAEKTVECSLTIRDVCVEAP